MLVAYQISITSYQYFISYSVWGKGARNVFKDDQNFNNRNKLFPYIANHLFVTSRLRPLQKSNLNSFLRRVTVRLKHRKPIQMKWKL